MCSETSLIVALPELRTQLLDDPELVGNVARQMILIRDSIDLVAEKIINHDNLLSIVQVAGDAKNCCQLKMPYS
jgi:hypothetical protein